MGLVLHQGQQGGGGAEKWYSDLKWLVLRSFTHSKAVEVRPPPFCFPLFLTSGQEFPAAAITITRAFIICLVRIVVHV